MSTNLLNERNDKELSRKAFKAYREVVDIVRDNLYLAHKEIISKNKLNKSREEIEEQDRLARRFIAIFDPLKLPQRFNFGLKISDGHKETANYTIGHTKEVLGYSNLIIINNPELYRLHRDILDTLRDYLYECLNPYKHHSTGCKSLKYKFLKKSKDFLKGIQSVDFRKLFIHEYVHSMDHVKMPAGIFDKRLKKYGEALKKLLHKTKMKWRSKVNNGEIGMEQATVNANKEYSDISFKLYLSIETEINARFIEYLQRGDFNFLNKLRRGKISGSFSDFYKEFLDVMRRENIEEEMQLWNLFPVEVKRRMIKRLYDYYEKNRKKPNV